jgi:two-component system response regulator AtoC
MRACSLRLQKPLTGLTPAAERVLSNAPWEGNVRELKNAIERACILAEGTLISERELAGAFGLDSPSVARAIALPGEARPGEPPAALEDIEREHIVDVLRQVKGNRMAAAKLLGISRRALYRRLERHHIVNDAPRPFGGTRS